MLSRYYALSKYMADKLRDKSFSKISTDINNPNCMNYDMDIDDLSKEQIMELYQNIGMMLGLKLVEDTFSEVEVKEFCMKRTKGIEKQIEEFMKRNGIES